MAIHRLAPFPVKEGQQKGKTNIKRHNKLFAQHKLPNELQHAFV